MFSLLGSVLADPELPSGVAKGNPRRRGVGLDEPIPAVPLCVLKRREVELGEAFAGDVTP